MSSSGKGASIRDSLMESFEKSGSII
jgi:hypothetical protein